MKRLLTVIFLMSLAAGAYAQMMPDSTVQVVAYWELGEKVRYQVEESKRKVSGTDTTLVEKSAEIITLEIVDVTDSTYRINVSYDDFQHSDYARMAANDALEKAYGKTSFDIITDQYGAFLDIELPDHFAEEGDAAIDEMVAGASRDKGLSKEEQKVVSLLVKSLISPEAITQAAIAEISPLLFFHGGRYGLSEEIEYDDEVESLFGDASTITMHARFWVDEGLTDEESVVMRLYQEADRDELQPYLASVLSQMTGAFAPDDEDAMKEMEEFLEESEMYIEDYVVEEVHLPTGWPIAYIHTRYVGMTVDDEVSEQIIRRSIEIMD